MTTNTAPSPVLHGGIARSGLDFDEPIIFARSSAGRTGIDLPNLDDSEAAELAGLDDSLGNCGRAAQEELLLPEISEPEAVRHYTRLSRWNYAIDLNTYPLGSCTMKYNPKINEWAARLPGFASLHPYLPEDKLQGALAIMWDLQNWLAEIAGFAGTSLQPAAGAHGELVGIMMMRAALSDRGDARKKILVPESAHGTNPATAAYNGYTVVSLKTTATGLTDPADVARLMDSDTAGIMLTNPNTLGIFESDILEISKIVHERGGFVYGDGANLNALLGVARPGDLGIDVMHFNLHKTFTTPHGGGGPGCGAVGAAAALEPYLPAPLANRRSITVTDEKTGQQKETYQYYFDDNRPKTIGRCRSFHGNFGMGVRAWTYIREMGAEGLRAAAQRAVLNANYIRARLQNHFHLPYVADSLHEVVFTDKKQKDATHTTTMDMAKRLMDYGLHPPTVYFPLVVQGALMIEPTETETKADLDRLCDSFISIAREAVETPDVLKAAPHLTARRRFDEVLAARKPVLTWTPLRS